MDKFIVSARKYRPATFSSVVGQQHITSTLKNAIERKQLAHAYLFCGPRGVGKTTCARIVAKAINCLNPTADNEACNECESCRAFNMNASFNIHELDAASNNSVEDIRELSRQVLTPPQIGKYSIYIIDEVHMLSSAAFNAFLKTLEEPPEYAIFILATTEKHKILPTILSRCQIYDFKRIKVEDVVNYLKMISGQEQVTYDEESLTLIAQKADGCMRDALSMYDKVVSFCNADLTFKEVAESLNILDYDTYFALTESLYEGDYFTALKMFDDAIQKGFDAAKILEGLNKHLRDMLVAKDERTLSLLEFTESVAQRFRSNAALLDTGFIFNAMSLITECEEKMRFSLNQRLISEITLLKISNLRGNSFQPTQKTDAPLPEKKEVPAREKTVDIKTEKTRSETSQASRMADSAPNHLPEIEPVSNDTAASDKKVESKNITDHISDSEKENTDETVMDNPADEKESSDLNKPVIETSTDENIQSIDIQEKEYDSGSENNDNSGSLYSDDAISIDDMLPAENTVLNSSVDIDRKNTDNELAEKPTGQPVAENKTKETDRTGVPQEKNRKTQQRPNSILNIPSLSNLMNGTGDDKVSAVSADIENERQTVPASQEELSEACRKFSERIKTRRQRMAIAFSEAKVEGNVIKISVENEILAEEINNHKSDILRTLCETGNVTGTVECEVTVEEHEQKETVVFTNDISRFKHLNDVNPKLEKLTKTLDLEFNY